MNEIRLKITKGEVEHKDIVIQKFPADFGRSDQCLYQFNVVDISRRHFLIGVSNDNIFIQDLTSTNGTYVNKKRTVTPLTLKEGDCIEAGSLAFCVVDLKTTLSVTPLHLKKIKPEEQPATYKREVLKNIAEQKEETLVRRSLDIDETSIIYPINQEGLLRSHRALLFIYEILEKYSDVSEYEFLLENLLLSLFKVVEADSGAVIFNWGRNKEHRGKFFLDKHGSHKEIIISRTILADVMANGVAIMSCNPQIDTQYQHSESLRLQGVRSLICVPLISSKKSFGVIYLDRRLGSEEHFSTEELDLLIAIALQLGNILEKLLLLAEVTKLNENLQLSNKNLEKALEDLKKTQAQVVQQERLWALGQMASGIAHDFNNALSPILGFSELLLSQTSLPPVIIQDYLQRISTAAHDATKVVARLSEFYRLRKKNDIFTSVDLNKLVLQVISLTKPRWRDQSLVENTEIKIIKDLQSIEPISGNESELREGLINIVFNAVDAISGQGQITFCTLQVEKHVILEISDSGIGMSEGIQQQCLEPFFSTKGESGSGLGLSMLYGILKRHEADLEIESIEQQGTTFCISLLVYYCQEKEDSEVLPDCNISPQRILVVEDEQRVSQVICSFIEAEGHEAQVAYDGEEGLQKFQEGNFDIVFTDRAMPKMGGEAMALAIKKISPNIPIILLTGFGDMMTANGEIAEGIDFIVGKPLDFKKFRTVLNNIKHMLKKQ